MARFVQNVDVRPWWQKKRLAIWRLLRMALEESSSPRELALSVGLGALVGSSPLLGLHSFVALGAASALRLNRLAAFVGSNVSFGPLIALLAWAELTIGCRFLGVPPLRGTDTLAVARDNLVAWWLGYAIVGPIVAVAAAAVAGGAARAYAARRSSSVQRE